MSNALGSIRVLAKYGSNLDMRNNIGETPLFLAVSYGHFEIVKFLIEESNVSPFTRSNEGE